MLIHSCVSPFSSFYQVVPFANGSGERGCLINQSIMSESNWLDYTLVMVLLQYMIPLVIISVTYGHMALVSINHSYSIGGKSEKKTKTEFKQ